MNEEFLKNIKAAHFVGIGGIGVSAVARLMLARGVVVSGSDRGGSLITEKLAAQGAKVFVGHEAAHVPLVCDLVVYSPAIPKDNPELVVAREKGIQTLSYPEALGMISRGMRTIAVSGTHGKTTTTGMLAEVFVGAHKEPTVIVGSLLKSGTNFIAGTSDIFIVEACEYQRSFLNLSPEVLVITNIDNDHLDYYGTFEGIQKAFAEMVEKVPAHGAIVCDPNDPRVAPVLLKVVARVVDYTKENLGVTLAVSGEHNIKNAKAALAVARFFGIDEKDASGLLAQFQGTWRRMEHKGDTEKGVPVYDDYAHHPTEIQATLQGFRAKFPDSRIRVVFQPHLYSRTKLLLDDFAKSFNDANEVIVAPIYAAREANDTTISSEILAQRIIDEQKVAGLRVWAMLDFETIEKYLRETEMPNDVVVTMGAGDIYKVGENILG
ncbi:MAG: UDP-N-acetylmuramate--L-alanine ligase [Candidatus Pacebacteria bacterium]|jgi:UDP-N-acetylmuramate--alanine ligase|nr:UDP-N-acetylmuramate--L-alanine ligase [Candidatus Paceibacterota bacterium]